MLEKYIPAKGCNKIRAHFYLFVEVLLLLLLRAAAAAHISTQADRGTTFSFLVAALLLLFTHREGCDQKNKIGFCFLFDTGTQSIAFSVTGYVLLLFLTAPGPCLHQRDAGYCFFLLRFCSLHCDASDVYWCCCSCLLLFLSLRLRCFGYGC